MTNVTSIVDFFGEYSAYPDVIYPVYGYDDNRAPMEIAIAKMGGGFLNVEYDGSWVYAIKVDGETIYSGTDLHSGTPINHAMAAIVLVDTLLNQEEPDEYEKELIKAHGARLQAWLDTAWDVAD